jgi:hypothetical protein
MRTIRYLKLSLVIMGIGILLSTLGCSSGGPPRSYAARGTVTLPDGKPAKGAYVRFFPTTPEGVEAEAELDDQGNFVLKSIGDKEGAVPGTYKVCIDPASPSPRPAAVTSAAKSAIPRSYWTVSSTPITLDVKTEDNEFKIKLKS